MSDNATAEPKLEKSIGIINLTLYGLGVTIGAGIYVLVGEAAGRAGIYAPSSFLLAAFIMIFSAASMAEFSSRIPKSAGDAAYVDAAFKNDFLTLATGGSIILAGIVAAAAISLGCAGYLAQLVDLPFGVIASIVVLSMGMIAAWGIKESLIFAGVLTVLEIAGLLAVIVAGFDANPSLLIKVPQTIPAFTDYEAISGILGASLLAFFAFIGFDDVVHIAEETKNATKVIPMAIAIILIVVTLIYFLVTLVAIDTLPIVVLADSKAPIGLLFERLTGFSPLSITLIAIFATMNGVVIQIIMSSRVAYGLAAEKKIPAIFARINRVTKTPVISTIVVTGAVLILALYVELGKLADITSQLVLAVFLLVNLALVRVKLAGHPVPVGTFTVHILFPIMGCITCLLLMIVPYII